MDLNNNYNIGSYFQLIFRYDYGEEHSTSAYIRLHTKHCQDELETQKLSRMLPYIVTGENISIPLEPYISKGNTVRIW